MNLNLFSMGIFLTVTLFIFPVPGFPLEIPGGQKGPPGMMVPKETSKDGPLSKNNELQGPKMASSSNPPIYNPPRRGAPGGRVGGGTRGIGDEGMSLYVLAPDHVGLTVQEQPTLYWFISKLTQHPLEAKIIEDLAVKPILKTQIPLLSRAGIHSIRLADYNVRLLPNREYWWFVAVVPDTDHRSKDILAGGLVKHIVPPGTLQTKLGQTVKNELFKIYAEEGLWYDAVRAISDLIEAAPNDIHLRKQRASLLEQVGLSKIAAYDRGQEITGGK
jgi:hypothetical protein